MKKILSALWLPSLILALWELAAAAKLLDPLFFPPPSQLLPAARRLIASGELGHHLGLTLARFLSGYAIGVSAGLATGILMGVFAILRRAFEPAISALYTTPKMSLLPMLMLLLGVGEAPRIVLIAAGSFIMLAIHGLDAVRGIDRTYLEMARNYGASRTALFRKVYLPATLPQVFTGLRLAMGRALMITVAVELVSSPEGLGGMIWSAWQTFATEKLYIGVILTAIMGSALHASLRRLETVAVPWRAR